MLALSGSNRNKQRDRRMKCLEAKTIGKNGLGFHCFGEMG